MPLRDLLSERILWHEFFEQCTFITQLYYASSVGWKKKHAVIIILKEFGLPSLLYERIACQYGALHLKFLIMFIFDHHLFVKWQLSHSFSQMLNGSHKSLSITFVAIFNGCLGITQENSEQKSW